MSMDRILRSSSQRPADGKPDPQQALVPRLPRAGQLRQGARRENDMDEWIKELILQRCLLILMFNGLRIKAGGSAKK